MTVDKGRSAAHSAVPKPGRTAQELIIGMEALLPRTAGPNPHDTIERFSPVL